MNELTIYSIENCAACLAAARFLAMREIPHKVIKIDEDMDAMLFIKKEGHRSFPQIYEGDKLFVAGGYNGLVKHFNNT
jgi:glutaredoxin